MSARQTFVLVCDGRDNADCTATFSILLRQAREVRAAAAVEGWVHVVAMCKSSGPTPSLDFCPKHSHLAEKNR